LDLVVNSGASRMTKHPKLIQNPIFNFFAHPTGYMHQTIRLQGEFEEENKVFNTKIQKTFKEKLDINICFICNNELQVL